MNGYWILPNDFSALIWCDFLFKTVTIVDYIDRSFKKIFIFRERGREGERGEKHSCVRNIDQLPFAFPQQGTPPTTQACALMRNWIGDLLVHRPAPSPLSHNSQSDRFFVLTRGDAIDYFFLFLEREEGEGKERERERNIDQLPLVL